MRHSSFINPTGRTAILKTEFWGLPEYLLFALKQLKKQKI